MSHRGGVLPRDLFAVRFVVDAAEYFEAFAGDLVT